MFKRDLELEKNWQFLLVEIERILGQKPKDLNGVLFLIGVQELGKGHQLFTKEQKQDLMHIAICKVLSYSDYYALEGLDAEGWPHWKMIKKLPPFDLFGPALGQRGIRHIPHDGWISRRRGHLGNAGAHLAGAEHPNSRESRVESHESKV